MPRNHEFDSARHANDLLGSRSEEEQRRIIYAMSAYDALMYDADFEAWAHESQLPPGREGWRVWLMMAGRGFGKTRAGAEWIHRLATKRSGLRIALIGATIDEARRIMVEGVSGLLTIARRQRRRVTGSQASGGSAGPTAARRNCFRATMRTGFAARSMISPGPTSSRNGVRRRMPG